MLTVTDVADRLDVTKQRVYQMIHDGSLPMRRRRVRDDTGRAREIYAISKAAFRRWLWKGRR